MKGSLQLSTNVMVTLILTIIIISIGFGIFFKIFANVDTLQTDIDSQSKRQLEVLLKDSDLALSKTKIEINRGEVGRVWLGIDNPTNNPVTYTLNAQVSGADIDNFQGVDDSNYFKYINTLTVGSEETAYALFLITPPKDALRTTYSVEITANNDEDFSRKLFVEVN